MKHFEVDADWANDPTSDVDHMQRLLSDAVYAAARQADQQVLAYLLSLDPGTRLCVHEMETVSRDWSNPANDVQFTVRQRVHILPSDDPCVAWPRGNRQEVRSPYVCGGCGIRRAPGVEQACPACAGDPPGDSPGDPA